VTNSFDSLGLKQQLLPRAFRFPNYKNKRKEFQLPDYDWLQILAMIAEMFGKVLNQNNKNSLRNCPVMNIGIVILNNRSIKPRITRNL